jgi:hypothetical protein
MALARISGLLNLSAPTARISARGPIEKHAAYSAVGQQPPRDPDTHPPAPSPPSLAAVAAASDGSGTARIPLRSQTTPSVPATTVANTVGEDSVAEPSAATPAATEQDVVPNAIPDDPELGPRERVADLEEAKTETDEPNGNEAFIDLDVLDGDDFMEGLRKERLFSPTAGDDVNFVATADISDSESDAGDEDVMADNEVAPEIDDGVEDVEDLEINEDVPDTSTFDLTDADLRDITDSGWITFDEENSSKSGGYRITRAQLY